MVTFRHIASAIIAVSLAMSISSRHIVIVVMIAATRAIGRFVLIAVFAPCFAAHRVHFIATVLAMRTKITSVCKAVCFVTFQFAAAIDNQKLAVVAQVRHGMVEIRRNKRVAMRHAKQPQALPVLFVIAAAIACLFEQCAQPAIIAVYAGIYF